MKKKLLGLILFWGLFAFSATASDSVLLRQKAQHATEEGNYEEAYQTYQKLSNQYDSVYQHVYSKEIEDLRATYQIDELAACAAGSMHRSASRRSSVRFMVFPPKKSSRVGYTDFSRLCKKRHRTMRQIRTIVFFGALPTAV